MEKLAVLKSLVIKKDVKGINTLEMNFPITAKKRLEVSKLLVELATSRETVLSAEEAELVETFVVNRKHRALLTSYIAGNDMPEVDYVEHVLPREKVYVINSKRDYELFVRSVRALGHVTLDFAAKKAIVSELGYEVIVVTDNGSKALKYVDQRGFYVSTYGEDCGQYIFLNAPEKSKKACESTRYNVTEQLKLAVNSVRRQSAKEAVEPKKLSQMEVKQICIEDLIYDVELKHWIAPRAAVQYVSDTALIETADKEGAELCSINMLPGSTFTAANDIINYEIPKTPAMRYKAHQVVRVNSGNKDMHEQRYENKEARFMDINGGVNLNSRNGLPTRVVISGGLEKVSANFQPEVVYSILSRGVLVGDKMYRPMIRTAAQGRVGKIWLASLEHKEIEQAYRNMSHGAFDHAMSGDAPIVMDKLSSRFGLPGTTSTPIKMYRNTHLEKDIELSEVYTKEVRVFKVDDVERPVEHPTQYLEYIEGADAEKDENIYQLMYGKETMMNINDGNGLADVTFCAQVAHTLGHISFNDLQFFLSNYHTYVTEGLENFHACTEVLDTDRNFQKAAKRRLRGIMKSLRTFNAFMVRAGVNVKGLLLMDDFKYRAKLAKARLASMDLSDAQVEAFNTVIAELENADCMLPTSMRKEDKGDVVRYNELEWRVCLVNVSRWGKARLSGQIMTTLNLAYEDLHAIIDSNIKELTEDVLNDYDQAVRTVGLLSSINEGSTSATTKVAQALAASRNNLQDPWIREKLLDLTQKALYELRFGKLFVDGATYFIAPEPRIFFSDTAYGANHPLALYTHTDLMNKDEIYVNGEVKAFALFRHPHAVHFESSVAIGSDRPHYWYLSDLILMNTYSPIAQGAGGGDFDGDRMLITDNERIVDTVFRAFGGHYRAKRYVLQGLPNDPKKVKYETYTRIMSYAKGAKLSQVGSITNKTLHTNDFKNHLYGILSENANPCEGKEAEAMKVEKARLEKLINHYQKIVGEEIKIATLETAEELASWKMVEELEKKVVMLSCLIGGATDAVKTGVEPVITEGLRPKFVPIHFIHEKVYKLNPAFFYANEGRKGEKKQEMLRQMIFNQYTNGRKSVRDAGEAVTIPYESKSAMGECYRYVNRKTKSTLKALAEQGTFGANTQALAYLAHFDVEEVEAIRPYVLEVMQSYGMAMARFQKAKAAIENETVKAVSETAKEEADKQLNIIVDYHVSLMNALHENKALIAAVVYALVHAEHISKSIYAPWALCYEGMLALTGEGTYNFSATLPKYVREESEIEVVDGMMFIDGIKYEETALADGIYSKELKGGRYVITAQLEGKASLTQEETNTFNEASNKIFGMKAVGFKYYGYEDGEVGSAVKFVEALKASNGIFSVCQLEDGRMGVVVNDVAVAAVQLPKGCTMVDTLMYNHKVCQLVANEDGSFLLSNEEGHTGMFCSYYEDKNGNIREASAMDLAFTIIGDVEYEEVEEMASENTLVEVGTSATVSTVEMFVASTNASEGHSEVSVSSDDAWYHMQMDQEAYYM